MEKFAQNSFYEAVNRRLVALTQLHPGLRVVDLGAGTGAVTQLLLEQVGNSKAEVIAVEPSKTAIEVARRNLGNLSDAVVKRQRGQRELRS